MQEASDAKLRWEESSEDAGASLDQKGCKQIGGFMPAAFTPLCLFAGVVFCVILTSLISFPKKSFAEVRNDSRTFNQRETCGEYYLYLRDEDLEASDNCKSTTNFLIDSADLEFLDFIETYLKFDGLSNSLKFLLNGQKAAILADPMAAYAWMDVADRQLYKELYQAGDAERANLYAVLVSEVKLSAFQLVCEKADTRCAEIRKYQEIRNIVGSEYSYLDDVRADFVNYCLLKSDNFSIPIRQVLSSTKFILCVTKLSDPT